MASFFNLQVGKPYVTAGLGTYQYTVQPSGGAGIYNMRVNTTVAPSSNLVTVVNQNGAPVYTSPVWGPVNTTQDVKVVMNCNPLDILQVVLSSTNPNDQQANLIKCIMTLDKGIGG